MSGVEIRPGGGVSGADRWRHRQPGRKRTLPWFPRRFPAPPSFQPRFLCTAPGLRTSASGCEGARVGWVPWARGEEPVLGVGKAGGCRGRARLRAVVPFPKDRERPRTPPHPSAPEAASGRAGGVCGAGCPLVTGHVNLRGDA